VSRLVQATCRYFFFAVGPGPARSGVSSPQMTRAKMISARIVVSATATAFAARDSSPCTHPSDGRVPDMDSKMSAHRSTGTWCITIKNTHQAWKFSPQVTVPGRVPRSGGFFPGRSSVLGGIEEFPLSPEISRSSRAIFSACSAS
jgi:hypothetical protein